MKSLTTALDIVALIAVVAGALLIHIGLGIIAAGVSIAAISITIDRGARERNS